MEEGKRCDLGALWGYPRRAASTRLELRVVRVRAVVGLGAARGLQAEVFQNGQCVRSPGLNPGLFRDSAEKPCPLVPISLFPSLSGNR